jgi:alpha-N-acetylglucosamine transferase
LLIGNDLTVRRVWRSRKSFAYVFYATNDIYAIAVIVFVRLLCRLGIRDDADLVVLHLQLSPVIVARLREMGMITVMVSRLGRGHLEYFSDCFVKLRSFQLTGYERVVVVDADAVPLKSLDFLFTLPFDGPLAAPRAYWLPQPCWASALLVVRPSRTLWTRLKRSLKTAPKPNSSEIFADMELVNREFGSEIHTLPREVNSEWEDVDRPTYFGDMIESYSKLSVIHFTALGKPWFYPTDEAQRLRPNAHPIFFELWESWREARDEIFSDPTLRPLVISSLLSQGLIRRHGMSGVQDVSFSEAINQ